MRYLDKLIDELAKGKTMDKILRSNTELTGFGNLSGLSNFVIDLSSANFFIKSLL